jgi:ribose 5-phosphate isomerase B
MKIAVASDHGGFTLKEALKAHLLERGFEVEDLGTHSEDSVDYPVYGEACARYVAEGKAERGIVCCGTGIGISMAANKVKGIRAACCSDYFSAKYTRAHNDANALCLGARVIGPGAALELVNVFLNTEFEGGRHQRRVDQITEIENMQ